MREIIVPIKGMHCKSCTILVTDELERLPGVTKVTVDLKTNTATIKATIPPTRQLIESAIKDAGYSVGIDNGEKTFINSDRSVFEQFFKNLIIISAIYVVFSNMGFSGLNFSGISGNDGLIALVIGLTAGFSTCMAMIGGLILGLSSKFAEKHPNTKALQKFKPHLFFNLGRIITFFILGGVIGLIGSAFSLNGWTLGFLSVAIGLVMILIGLQLTEIFPRLDKIKLTLPAKISKIFGVKKHSTKEYQHKNAMILGGLTFFLPCGFTQAMQLVAIGSGNFVTGSIVMGLFAIGTAPGLLGIGGLTSALKGAAARTFFRFAGVVVIALSFYNISTGFNLMGIQPLNFNFGSGQQDISPELIKDAEIISATYSLGGGLEPTSFKVKAKKTYILEVNSSDDGQGCMSTILIPGQYDKPQLIKKNKKIQIPFNFKKSGEYQITCAMGIPFGTIEVSE